MKNLEEDVNDYYDIRNFNISPKELSDKSVEIETSFRQKGEKYGGFPASSTSLNPVYMLSFLFPNQKIKRTIIKDYIFKRGLRSSIVIPDENNGKVSNKNPLEIGFDKSDEKRITNNYTKYNINSFITEIPEIDIEIKTSVSREVDEGETELLDNFNLIRYKERFSVDYDGIEISVTLVETTFSNYPYNRKRLEIEIERKDNLKFQEIFNELNNQMVDYLFLFYQLMEYYGTIVNNKDTKNKNAFQQSFVGQMPVAFTGSEKINKKNYQIRFKPDGERVHLLIFDKYIHFLHRNGLEISESFIIDDLDPAIIYILDGELVLNTNGDISIFLFDIIAKGKDIIAKDKVFSSRYKLLYKWLLPLEITDLNTKEIFNFVISPEIQKSDINNQDSFSKFMEFENGETYPVDGFIIQDKTDYYVFGTDKNLFKWKDVSDLTIDFRIKFLPNESVSLEYELERGGQIIGETIRTLEMKNNTIGEFIFNNENKQWNLVRLREDKNKANFASTVISTMQAILNNFTYEQFIEKVF